MFQTIGVLLAGGESKRFGSSKAFATYRHHEFWEHSYNVLKNTTDHQLIISHPRDLDSYEQKSIPVLLDDLHVRGLGPLAGIYTAMNHYNSEWFVVLSCDIPKVTPEIIKKLLECSEENVQAVIPTIEGKIHPLIGIYHQSIFKQIETKLKKNELKMIKLLDEIQTKYVKEDQLGVTQNAFSNINSQEDYRELLKHDKLF
ncbi:molybdenum cofactor guanylyltransferase [Bacillus weihaiensis]|uniref:molybdenum cofactor guanylyltransferase n=1 Tax=Bacillus weihaiensis TaxID=1547283 RepID=UPI002355B888|nr:molybdenum cofactor guanylyltransferase [Bacillus weihaiensis]